MDTLADFEVKTKDDKKSFVWESLKFFPKLFSINENEVCTIKKTSNKIDLWIEVCEDVYQNHLREIVYGDCAEINSNNVQHPPLTYKIIVKNVETNQLRGCFYEIKPIGMKLLKNGLSQYDYLKKEICDFNEFQLFDDNQSTFSGKISNRFNGRKFFESVLNSLHRDYDMIISSLVDIEKKPIVNIKKMTCSVLSEGKISRRSLEKEIKKYGQNKKYVERLYFEYDNESNRYLMFILKFSKVQLIAFRKKIDEYIKNITNSIDDILQNDTNTTSIDSIKQRTSALNNLNEKLKKAKEADERIEKIIAVIEKILNNNHFDIKESKYSPHQFRLNKKYALIERHLFLPLSRSYIFSPFAFNSLSTSAFKKTSSLFEIYCLISLFKCFESYGFLCIDENYKDQETNLNGMSWIFIKNDYKIKISYEVNVSDFIEEERDELCFINSTANVSPDFWFVLLFKDQPIYLAVIDAKCRKKGDIRKANLDKMDRVRAYLSFRYCPFGKSIKEGKIVDDLVFLYPSDDKTIYKETKLEYAILPMLLNGNEEVLNMFIGQILSRLSK